MKTWQDEHIFNFSWDIMVRAAYRKYPNPRNPNIKSIDVLERRMEGRRLYSHRLFATLWNVPTIVLTILGSNPFMYINEQSECNLENKTLTIAAKNLSLTHLFRMDELLEYRVHPIDPSKTVLRQTSRMSVFGIPLLGGMLESILLGSYESTVSNGRLAVAEKAEQIELEDTSLPG